MIIKTPEQIQAMREGGPILAKIVQLLALEVRGGLLKNPLAVDARAEQLCTENNVVAGTKGYRGFPGSLCVSVNHQVVHGVPGPRDFRKGDLVKLDMVIQHKGMMVDTAVTVPFLGYRPGDEMMVKNAHDALNAGIAQCRAGNSMSQVAGAIEAVNKKLGYSSPFGLGGHGIGANMHEEPFVPNQVMAETDCVLPAGIALAIEPISMAGKPAIKVLSDGWTIVSEDGMRSAHFEHTVIVTDGEPEVVTAWTKEMFETIVGVSQ